MEYCEGGDLSIFIRNYKQLKEDICRSFLSQLAFALQYLRQHNIVHMDLKPSNLLLTSRKHPVLKLAGNANQLLPTHILKKSLFIIFWMQISVWLNLLKTGKKKRLTEDPHYTWLQRFSGDKVMTPLSICGQLVWFYTNVYLVDLHARLKAWKNWWTKFKVMPP